MILPLKTTQKYCKLPKKVEESLEIISNKIGAVEDVQDLSKKYENIYIAEIVEKREHPDADKLGIYMITIDGDEKTQVLAGDKNLEVGDKVAYIKPGGIVPSTYYNEPFEIKSVKMRGEMSNGMMCSQRELDIGPCHDKVLVLSKDAPVGESFAKYYELDDTIIDIENKALTNRGDLFGIIGLAREISACQGIEFESPKWLKEPQINLEPSEICLNLDVDNQAEPICPRYCAIAMSNIKMTDSPIWLKSVLLKSDIKPINIVVDITNYLMLVTGQPLHAFDLDKVINTDSKQADMAHIVVRTGRPEEKILGIDDNLYDLNDNHLIIANSQNPIAIAGVIGGKDTEIDENSTNIIIESANFDRYNLRRTSMELGIVTEASTRFTRSQSPENCLPVLSKAVELIQELAQGEIASTLIDSYPTTQKENLITLNINKLKEKLGLEINCREIEKILKDMEYEIVKSEDEYLTVKVPKFRLDIEIEEDVYEDVIRIYGYDKMEYVLPTRYISATFKPEIINIKSKIRSVLSNSGCNELISYSFTNIQALNLVKQNPDNCFKLLNPISQDLELMRPSILLSLLEKARVNIQQDINTFCIYEMGISHQKDNLNKENLPLEEWKLSLLFTDSTDIIEGNPYYQAKRYLEKVLNSLKIQGVNYTLLADVDFETLPIWIKNIAGSFEANSSSVVSIRVGESRIFLGILGEIELEVKRELGLNTFTSGFEINLEQLNFLNGDCIRDLKESKYPYITQDICFVVPEMVTYQELYEKVTKSLENNDLRSEMRCIDIYKKEKSEDRNITVRISLSNTKKTLTDKDFKKIREKIEKNIKKLDISMLQ
jgi:phenylalanyl-tRNA synthetase beta chain